jgi:CofD-related protein of GAK system
LITPFDSGGSSQVLRKAFDMPAVGDLRSRLVALAENGDTAAALLSHRLSEEAGRKSLQGEFRQLIDGSHPLVLNVERDVQEQILRMLEVFAQNMPANFDLRRASVGNLVLAGGYLVHDRALEPVLEWMSNSLGVLGTVRAIADVNLQIGVDLDDGSRVIGQANFTGKDAPPIRRPIQRLFLADRQGEVSPDQVPLSPTNTGLIEAADLICFPPGSLFSSVIANLLPSGVGQAVAARHVPKIYVPSLGCDPECFGMSLSDQIGALLSALRRDAGQDRPAKDLISLVVSSHDVLTLDVVDEIARVHGLKCLALDVAERDSSDRYDPERLSRALLSLS